MGVDVRRAGSGNIGATNVARTVGARAGLLTLLADVAKGAVPLIAGRAIGTTPEGLSIAAVAAVLGHVFPAFARLRGGKGVATAAGAFLVLAPQALAGSILVFAVLAASARRVSLASIGAVLALPAFLAIEGGPGASLAAAAAIALIVVAKHRENIARLVAGTEPAFRIRRS